MKHFKEFMMSRPIIENYSRTSIMNSNNTIKSSEVIATKQTELQKNKQMTKMSSSHFLRRTWMKENYWET